MSKFFDDAFEYTLGDEGGYTNDRNDSGGPTNWGITIHDLSVHLGRPATTSEVKSMTKDTAKEIYSKRYWAPLDLDQIKSDAVAICMFDIGVVRGISVPPKYAQQICYAHGSHIAVDGVMGPMTIAAINQLDPATFIRDFSIKTEAGFHAIVAAHPKDADFIHGWVNRARRLLTLIHKYPAVA